MADIQYLADRGALISSVRVEKTPTHWRIHVWNRGGKAGELCVNAADGPDIVDRLIPHRVTELESART